MAFPNRFLRNTLQWTLPGGENASCTVAWNSGAEPTDLDSVADSLAARALTLANALRGYCPASTVYVGCMVRVINTDNHIGASYARPHAPIAGTTGTNALPNEVAVVSSLYSALAGKSSRGRIYLPPLSVDQTTTTGLLSTATADALAVLTEAYCAPLTVDTQDFVAVVASKTTSAFHEITHGRVGNVFDSQRPRRWSQVEASSRWPA